MKTINWLYSSVGLQFVPETHSDLMNLLQLSNHTPTLQMIKTMTLITPKSVTRLLQLNLCLNNQV